MRSAARARCAVHPPYPPVPPPPPPPPPHSASQTRVNALMRGEGREGADPGAPPLDVVMPARTILVAAGTQPNTVLGREEPQHVAIDGKYFQAFDEAGRKGAPERVTTPC